jgi:leader peptidase (prepilin peptidase)/N-methyltransferase
MQYPLIEAINGCGYVFIFWVNGFSIVSALECLLLSVLIAISVIDWRTYEIPIGLNIAILILGCIRAAFDYRQMWNYLIGFFAISCFMLLVLYLGRAIKGIDGFGGGDIKLMAAAGMFLGWKNVILAFFIGCILGAVIHPIRMKLSGENHMLAFGPYLSAGIIVAMLFGSRFIGWYFGLF